MAQNNETRVPKTSTFEEWRQSTNRVSFDVGPVESNDNKTSDSLDKETRLTDQAKTVNVTSGAASTTSVDVGASAWENEIDIDTNPRIRDSRDHVGECYLIDSCNIP